jgi:hypothetical protein
VECADKRERLDSLEGIESPMSMAKVEKKGERIFSFFYRRFCCALIGNILFDSEN